jgi:hypothetical protein
VARFRAGAVVAPIALYHRRPNSSQDDERRIGINALIKGRPPTTSWTVNPRILTSVVVIALGLVMLIATVTDSQLVGQVIVLLLGVTFLTWGVMVRHPAPLIPGCILTGLGAGIVLGQWLFTSLSAQAQSGVITLCMGLGFLLIMPAQRFVTRQTAHWWPLIPGGFLSLTGAGLLLGDAGLTMLIWMGRLWPLALIGVGVTLLYRAARSQRTGADAQPTVPPPSPPSPPSTTVPDPALSQEQGSDAHEPVAAS